MGSKATANAVDFIDEATRSYALNVHCEETGNVWIQGLNSRFGFRGTGPIVNAESRGTIYTSAMFGRLERRTAYVISEVLKRKIPRAKPREDLPTWLDSAQVSAIENAMNEPVSIVVGGPGTGKTTIAKIISHAHSRVLGLSPTGKGAERLQESVGIACFTIHRLFYNEFVENDNERLVSPNDWANLDLIICDEMGMTGSEGASMLAMIMHKAKNARIVMMGDTGQLPSVDPGCVLSELMTCMPTSTLNVVFRFDDYHIGMACSEAKVGKIYQPRGRNENYEVTSGSNLEIAIDCYRRNAEIFGNTETRLLTFHRADTWKINRRLAFSAKVTPVVCDKNNYRLSVFNGQTGIMKGKMLLFGTSNLVKVKSILWSYAFASTCHKAQGGQWDCVIVWIPSARYICPLWLNTALSRAVRKLVVLIDGDVATVERCMKTNARNADRISLLADFVSGRAKWLTAME